MTPLSVEDIIKVASFVVAALSALAGGVWTVTKYLQQQRQNEEDRRAERIVMLLSEFNKVNDNDIKKKIWTVLELSIYPNKTLTMIEAINLNKSTQVLLIGDHNTSSIQEVDKLAKRTKAVMQNILLRSDNTKSFDFDGVDLSGITLRGMRFNDGKFRLCDISRVDFYGAKLHASNLRGAKIKGTCFVTARLSQCDFTGAEGAFAAEHSRIKTCTFDHAKIEGSKFDGGTISLTTMKSTKLARASFHGTTVTDCTWEKTNFEKLAGKKLTATNCQFTEASFVYADFTAATFTKCSFIQCKMMAIDGTSLNSKAIRYETCDFGGSTFVNADFSDTVFEGCKFGGSDFLQASFAGAKFIKCDISTGKFSFDIHARNEKCLTSRH
jgi:uncharacterized protein YjbI with pentapeptide repeats